jgi:hypothetical protein
MDEVRIFVMVGTGTCAKSGDFVKMPFAAAGVTSKAALTKEDFEHQIAQKDQAEDEHYW